MNSDLNFNYDDDRYALDDGYGEPEDPDFTKGSGSSALKAFFLIALFAGFSIAFVYIKHGSGLFNVGGSVAFLSSNDSLNIEIQETPASNNEKDAYGIAPSSDERLAIAGPQDSVKSGGALTPLPKLESFDAFAYSLEPLVIENEAPVNKESRFDRNQNRDSDAQGAEDSRDRLLGAVEEKIELADIEPALDPVLVADSSESSMKNIKPEIKAAPLDGTPVGDALEDEFAALQPASAPILEDISKIWHISGAQPGKAVLKNNRTGELISVETGSIVRGLGTITKIGREHGKWVVNGTKSSIQR